MTEPRDNLPARMTIACQCGQVATVCSAHRGELWKDAAAAGWAPLAGLCRACVARLLRAQADRMVRSGLVVR